MIEVKEINEKVYDDTYDKKLRDELIDKSLAGIATLRESFNKMYGIGQKAGFELGLRTNKEANNGYKDGLEDAWNYARKLILSPFVFNEALSVTAIHQLFNGLDAYEALANFSAEDVINKIKEYEDTKGKDINAPTKKDVAIGDEVRNLWGTVGVVVGIPSQDNSEALYSVACWDAEERWYCIEDWARDEFVFTEHCLKKKENMLSSTKKEW